LNICDGLVLYGATLLDAAPRPNAFQVGGYEHEDLRSEIRNTANYRIVEPAPDRPSHAASFIVFRAVLELIYILHEYAKAIF
jgi:hypothetical protein